MTKKIFLGMSAMAMLFATSCQDDLANSFVGEEATVEFNISSGDIATRAFSDGTTVDHLHYAIYEKHVDGNNVSYEITDLVKTGNDVVALTESKATINVALKTGKDYQAIFWADDVEAPYTVAFGDKGATMTVDYDADKTTCNDETRDAFYASVPVNISGNESKTVTLTRPFAQLNIGTNDYDAAKTAGYEPTLSSVTVDAYSAMDLMSGNVTGESIAKTFGYAAIPSAQDETFPVAGYEYLAMNYILVGNDKVTSEVTFRYKEGENAAEETKTVGSVPFQRNYRTNIYGSLLTGAADINVEIEANYAEEEIAILDAFKNGGEVTLQSDLEVVNTLTVEEGAEVVLNLNGKKINGAPDCIQVKGHLIIRGEGEVHGAATALWANGGTIDVYGGTYTGVEEQEAKNGCAVVFANNGLVNIYGGSFRALYPDKNAFANKTEGVYAALNMTDNKGAINVYGGSFYKQNPAAPGTEPKAWNDTHPNGFVANGYKSVQDGDNYNVVADYTTVSTVDQFKEALSNNSAKNIYLEAGKTFEGTFTVKADKYIFSDATIKATIKGRVNVQNCNPTFENVKFDRNDNDSNSGWDTSLGSSNCLQYKAVVMIYGDQTNKVTFKKCDFYNNNGTHKSAITNVAVELIVDECYFEGRSSSIYSQCNLSVTNSTFNYTGGNNVIASINGCGASGGKFIFKNNQSTGSKIYALAQFMSTTGFGNGTYYFDVDTCDYVENYFFNTSRVVNKSFADGSVTF